MPRYLYPYDEARSQGQLWTPDLITDLMAWYDPGDTHTVTVDESGNISQLLDKSGNGKTLTQADAATRPAYDANSWACGVPSIKWDYAANSKYLKSASLITHQQVFIAGRYRDGVDTGTDGAPYSGLFAGDTLYYGLLRIGTSTSWYNSPSITSASRNGGPHVAESTFTAIPMPETIYSVKLSPQRSSAFTAGYDKFTVAEDRGWQGNITGIILTRDLLSQREEDKIVGYMAWSLVRYGCTVLVDKLPASHRFKNRPPLRSD